MLLTHLLWQARNRETLLKSEAILLNQKHQQVLTVTERALDDANATIATQSHELEELDRLQQRYIAAEDKLRTQQAASDQMTLQLQSQLDLYRSEYDKVYIHTHTHTQTQTHTHTHIHTHTHTSVASVALSKLKL